MGFKAILILSLIALSAAREINQESQNLIKDFEKWRPCAYTSDGANKLTIGYGHLVKPGDGITIGSCITEQQGLDFFKNDVAKATRCIDRVVRVSLTENQFGALVSWTFNVGCGNVESSTLVRKLNEGSEANQICEELRKWNKVTIDGKKQVSKGLVRRRESECKLYKSNGSDVIDESKPTRDINNKGLSLIKDYEKWRGCAFRNIVDGKITIGYGHLVKPGDNLTAQSCITHLQGHDLLINDLSEAIKCIEKIVHVSLDDNQFGALISWAFNMGCENVRQSTLVEKLNAGSQADEICDELRKWNNVTVNGTKQVSDVLVKRREDECKLYKSIVRDNAAREINDKSLNFIKSFKKWQQCAFSNNGTNNITIGYGHLVKSGESFTNASCITEDQGLDLLRKDLSEAGRCIERVVRRPLTDNQFGALVSWTFNSSEGPFDDCAADTQTPLKILLNSGQPDEICNEFRVWNKANHRLINNELVLRREDECTLYKSNGDDPIVRINVTCTMVNDPLNPTIPTCKADYHTKAGLSCYYWCRFDWNANVPKSCNLEYLGHPSQGCK